MRKCQVPCMSLVLNRPQLLLLMVVVAVFGLGSVPASQGLSETILCSQKCFGIMGGGWLINLGIVWFWHHLTSPDPEQVHGSVWAPLSLWEQ